MGANNVEIVETKRRQDDMNRWYMYKYKCIYAYLVTYIGRCTPACMDFCIYIYAYLCICVYTCVGVNNVEIAEKKRSQDDLNRCNIYIYIYMYLYIYISSYIYR